MSEATDVGLSTYEWHHEFGNDIQVVRAGAVILSPSSRGKQPVHPRRFVLVIETPHSDPPDVPHLHLRFEEAELRSLVALVSPHLAQET